MKRSHLVVGLLAAAISFARQANRMDFSTPLRCILNVRPTSIAQIRLARKVEADAVLLDLTRERGAALPEGRSMVCSIAFHTRRSKRRPGALLVKAHDRRSPEFAADCDAVARAQPDGIVLSGCQSAEDVYALEDGLGAVKDAAILPELDTAAEDRIWEIATASRRIVALCRSSGMARDEQVGSLVRVGKELGLPVIDAPFPGSRTPERFLLEATEARMLGFNGKVTLRCSEVTALKQIFSPTEEEMVFARSTLSGNSGNNQADDATLRRACSIAHLILRNQTASS
jgi:citrate lyase subunit beta/citryl-CoA lyase